MSSTGPRKADDGALRVPPSDAEVEELFARVAGTLP